MKKHLLFGLIFPLVSLILLITLSFPFISLEEEIEFSLASKIIIISFLLLTLGFLAYDSYLTKSYRITFILSLIPLLFLNNNLAYSIIFIVSFFYIIYLLVMYKKTPRAYLTYGLYNRLSYNIYTTALALIFITMSLFFIIFRQYYFLILSVGLSIILVLAYNIYYDQKITKIKKSIISNLSSNNELLEIYTKYEKNLSEETKATLALYLSLGYLLDGNYLEGAKYFDLAKSVKLFDISLYQELKVFYDYLVNHSFNKCFKDLALFEEYIKKIKSKQKRSYLYTRLNKLKELLNVLALKKQVHEDFTKYESLDGLYEYLIKKKLGTTKSNLAYDKTGINLLFF